MFARIMGVVCIALGLLAVLQGGDRPRGNWAWLTGAFFDVMGNVGVAGFYVLIGLFLLLIGFRKKDLE